MPCERICNEEGKTEDDSTCLACQQKQPYRTHAYVSAINPKTREHFLFECTGTAAKPLEEHAEAAGTLRGCHFAASRPKGGPNSKVIIITNQVDPRKVQLPEPPNIPAALAVIWRLPRAAIEVALSEPGAPSLHTNGDILKDVREQEDNAEGADAFNRRRSEVTEALLHPQKRNGQKRKKVEA